MDIFLIPPSTTFLLQGSHGFYSHFTHIFVYLRVMSRVVITIVYKSLIFMVMESNIITSLGGARGVMIIVVGNEHGDTSSNPGRDWLHFT